MTSPLNYSSLVLSDFKNLFVPLDGTEWHEQAISYSLLLSEWFESKIDLFFSLADLPPLLKHGEWEQRAQVNAQLSSLAEPGSIRSMNENGAFHEFGKILAYDYLNEITKRLEHLDVDVDVDVAAGSPAHILAYKAQTSGDAMVVMYARPQSRLNRYFGRKMAEELLTVATVPVLMLNESTSPVSHFRDAAPESIIVPIRNSSAMRAALPIAAALAAKSNAKIELLAPNASSTMKRENGVPEVEQLEGWLADKGFDVHATLHESDPCSAVVQAQHQAQNPWVIMGSRMRRGVTRTIFPSLADNVRREASCPVLVAPQQEVLPKREAAIQRWLIDWRADQDHAESGELVRRRQWRPVAVPNALIFFRDGDPEYY